MAATILTRMGAEKGVLFQQQNQNNFFRLYISEFHKNAKSLSNVAHSESSRIRPYDEIPGFAIISKFWHFLPIIGGLNIMEPEKMHRTLQAQYGDVVRMRGLPGRGDMVFAYHPKDVETVFRNEGPWPNRPELQSIEYYRKVHRKDTSDEGLTSRKGPSWLEMRRKVNSVMMQPRTSNRYIPKISEVAQEFIERIQLLRDIKSEVPPDFMNELFKFSLESIAYLALDMRLGCLAPNLAPDSELQKTIDAVGIFFDSLFHLENGIPIWKVFPTNRWKKFTDALNFYGKVSSKFIKEAMKKHKQCIAEGREDIEPSILERLLARMNPESAIAITSEIIFSGVDTTAYSIVMAIYQLSKNQEKQEILFQELKQHLPDKNDVITEDKIENMKYLRACLKESVRIRPVFTGHIRVTATDIILSNYRVPKGVPVFMPNAITLKSEEFFPMCEKFIPERWLKNQPGSRITGSFKDFDKVSQRERQNPFSFLPFGFGARSCVGRRFAQLEMEILLAKIIRNFHIEYNYGEVKFVTKILCVPKDPLKFKMKLREE